MQLSGKSKGWTDDENAFLDRIDEAISAVDKSDPEKADAMLAEWQGFIDNAKNFPDQNLRTIYLQKAMRDSKYFSNKGDLEKLLSVGDNKVTLPNDYWRPHSDKEIKASNVNRLDAEGQNPDFFNWDSDRHWSKLNTADFKEAADYLKMNPKDLLDYAAKEQTRRDREDLFSFSNDPLAFGASIMMPRTAEAIMRGEDPDKLRDVAMDFGENLVYSLNPGGKVANLGTKVIKPANKFTKTAVGLLGAGVEPTLMEGADALVYGNSDVDTDRKNFSVGDVLIGTGVNKLFGSMTPDIKSPKAPGAKTLNQEQIDPYLKQIKKTAKALENVEATIGNKERLGEPTEKLLARKQKLEDDLVTLYNDIPDPQVQWPSKKEMAKYKAKDAVAQNAPGALNVVTNRTGDVMSEDPRFQNRALRLLGGRMLAPYLIDFTKPTRDENTEVKQQMYDLLGR